MTLEDQYQSIAGPSEGEFKGWGSKFIAYIFPIASANEFQVKLDEIKSLHPKSRHHCFAYRLLHDDAFRYYDDGEPSGTAGKPIFNQLISKGLKNVLCIVVRYFGGTKLGTSGLINAYKEATLVAIDNNEIVIKYLEKTIDILFDYSQMGTLMNAVKHLGFKIEEKSFDESPRVSIAVPQSQIKASIVKLKAYLLNRKIEDINDETSIDGIVFKPRE